MLCVSKQCCTSRTEYVTRDMTISPNLVKYQLSISIFFYFNIFRYLVKKLCVYKRGG